MEPELDLLIVHDSHDTNTASRIAAVLAERGLPGRPYELREPHSRTRMDALPVIIPPFGAVVLLISSARSDWDEIVVDSDYTHLIVADLTDGAIQSLPRSVREIVPIHEFESGIAQLAFLVEQALDFPGDASPGEHGAESGGTASEPSKREIDSSPSSVTLIYRADDGEFASVISLKLLVTVPILKVSHEQVHSLASEFVFNSSRQDRRQPRLFIVSTVEDVRSMVESHTWGGLILARTPDAARALTADPTLAGGWIDFTDMDAGYRRLVDALELNVVDPQPQPDAAKGPSVGTQTGAGNDRVAQTDALGFRHYVRAFVDLIESAHTKPPLTIGIYGSWGMGKSFLLEHVIARLRENQKARAEAAKHQPKPKDDRAPRTPDVYAVSFNAWEYSATEVIWPGLVRKIMDTVEREVSGGKKRRWRKKLRRNFMRRLKEQGPRVMLAGVVLGAVLGSVLWQSGFDLVTAAITFSAVGLAGLGKVLVDTLNAPLSQWVTALFQETDYGKQIGHMAEIRDDLELLETLLREENGRMVVVIDDLDRCEPEKAVEMLQAINLLLNFESFIVVMGIDARIVTRAIEKHYKDLLGPAGASGYEYLDKIVQIPFRIPESEPHTIRDFLTAQLSGGVPAQPGVPAASGAAGAADAPAKESGAVAVTDDAAVAPGSAAVAASGNGRAGGAADNPTSGTRTSRLYWSDPYEARTGARRRRPVPVAEREEDTPVLPPPPAFSPEELAAFEAAAAFLKPNPRHIKRLVNVYRLVRTLAHLRSEDTILRNPAATLRWLITSSQWPYAAHAMLTHFADMEDRGEALPDGDPLPVLMERADPILKVATPAQRELDHDHDVLRALLKSGYGVATSEELKVIRRYTVNFNPAVERELLLSMQEQASKASKAKGSGAGKAAEGGPPKRKRPPRARKAGEEGGEPAEGDAAVEERPVKKVAAPPIVALEEARTEAPLGTG